MTTLHWVGLLVIAAIAAATTAGIRRCAGGAWVRFARAPLGPVAMGWLLFMVLIAIAAPWLAPFRPSLQLDILTLANQPPSWRHPLGTDLLSRDIWSRILFGARVSLGVGVLSMVVAVILGGATGMLAGLKGGRVDSLLMRLVDVGLAVPRIFVVLVGIALWQQVTGLTLIAILGATGWFATSRLVRADTLVLRHSPMIESARALGASTCRLLVRHILPNVAGTLLVSAALGIGAAMLLEAALSFLGVGIQPPEASWGNMIADGRDHLATAPWTTVFPGLAIALAVMALNAVGDGIRDALDPRIERG